MSYSTKKQQNLSKSLLEGSKFLEDFDPETSRREKNKRKIYTEKPIISSNAKNTSLYDEMGRIRLTKEDICDCFDIRCPGCFFPCASCKSQKCGIKCRVGRKWAYEVIEHDGKDKRLVNQLLKTSYNPYI